MNKAIAQAHVTTRTVAERAGVSQPTVSRALRDDPHISPATREKVKGIARDLGYRPNPYVAAFTAQVRGYRRAPQRAALAILNLHRPDHQMPFLASYTRGAIARANSLGFQVNELHYGQLGREVDRLPGILRARGIRGLLILPLPIYEDLTRLNVEGLAVATIDLTDRTPPINHAVPDYFRAMLLALSRLQDRGYERIGFCTKAVELTGFGRYCHAAYLLWQRQIPAARRLPVHIDPSMDSEKPVDRSAFGRWLSARRPDAVVSNDHRFQAWIRTPGARAPRKVAYATLSWNNNTPVLAGIDQRQDLVGAAAMDLVIAQIYRNEYGLPDPMKTVSVQGVWRDGQTCRPGSSPGAAAPLP